MKIGQHIYQLRTTQNLTQEELASKVYVTRQTVSNWERGYSYPDLQSITKLAHLFDLTVEQLLKDDLSQIERTLKMRTQDYFNTLASELTLAILWFIATTIALFYFFQVDGLIAALIVCSPWLILKASQVEKIKLHYNLETYQEISDFMAGKIKPSALSKDIKRHKMIFKSLHFLLAGILGFLITYFLIKLIT
ncbi:helix-turn-helix domain-containing protein [Streptococcus pluranimalium]|uniref:HTH cro/C1-type domain-containing protein n=1 Tax=Streptococcus pluranimalium TaxID=82348 RepID=A0A2L0D6E3_9STRE|nr:helix-turn-helix transcriptional regulator [Streptococcus pluranimalium]AUW97416.1 hypothetical protein C0J00_10050 [Streptococcus pluranimalium]